MSKEKALITLIQASEKKEFDKIIKTYLKEVYDHDTIIITDGSNDIGLDIKTFDLNKQNIQYQLTTQKSETQLEKKQFDKKIKEDLQKAKINVTEYGYSNTLHFFYSYKLSNKVIREYEKIALNDFGINITIIDANRIAQEAEDIVELQRVIFSLNNLDTLVQNEEIFPNEEKNLVFDLIGLGKPMEFKLQIVESFLLQSLYPDKTLTKTEIINCCKEKFKTDDNPVFYDKLLNRLQSSKQIALTADKTRFTLSNVEFNRIKTLMDQYDFDEDIFIKGVYKILEEYNQQSKTQDYISQLKKIYIDNFNSEIFIDLNDPHTHDFNRISREFYQFLKNNVNEINAKSLAIKLFSLCQENNFLQKFCAGKVFSEKTNLTKIENYINTQKRIFIDTQIVLHSLCYFYSPNTEYNNYFFHITKSLIQYCKKIKLIFLYLIDIYGKRIIIYKKHLI